MTLTVIVPTIGRPTLGDTLASIARQRLVPGDQVLIAYDSHDGDTEHEAQTRALVASFGFTFVPHDGGYHFYGNPQLNHAMTLATGDFVTCLGDDDVYVDGAFDRLRKALKPGRVTLCQFYSPPFETQDGPQRFLLWDLPKLRVARISGCCLIAPTKHLVPVSTERRIEVDFDWIVDVVAKSGKPPLWLRDCLIIARPDVRNGQTVHMGVAACAGCGDIVYTEDLDADRLCAECVGSVLAQFLEAHA